MAHDVFELKHEILVAGGGLVGWAAAVTAARVGRKALLVSRRPNLGWEITSTLCQDIARGVSPLADELLARLAAQNAACDGRASPPLVELMLDRMLEEAGAELLLYAAPHVLARAGGANGRVCGVHVASKSGAHTLMADLVIDATDLRLPSREAGAPLRVNEIVPGRSTIAVNLAEGDVEDGCALGDAGKAKNVTLRRSVWPGEVMATFDLGACSPIDAQLAAPEVLRLVRETVPELRTAMVTTMSVELLPLASTLSAEGDLPAFAEKMGSRLVVADLAPDGATPGTLIALGESVGRKAAAAWQKTATAEPGAAQGWVQSHECDVLVAGGGTAGALAAIAAARQGARTTVIEPLTYLGGIGTGGGIHSYYHGVSDDIQDELDGRVAELAPLFSGGREVQGFHPDAKKVALLEMAVAAGAEVVCSATVSSVVTEPVEPAAANGDVARRGGPGAKPPVRIGSLMAVGPDGAASFAAKVLIDSTGDGDVAAMAGAPFAMGREGDGLLHAFSQSAGHITRTKEGEPRLGILNFDAGYVDPDDVVDLTRGRRLGLKRLWRDAYTPDQRWTYIAPHLGLRQGRQILGDYQLTMADEIAGRRFPDVIAYALCHYDNHAVDYENESDAGAVWTWLLGQWHTRIGCEVPYRCLLPQGVEGLLVACRALSITQDAHYQLRMQRDMQRIGIAAGIAAALAAKKGVTPRAVDVREVQAILTKTGALRETDRPRAALPDKTTGELVGDLATDAAPPAVWQLSFQHADALPALRESAASGPPAARFWSSVALAMARDKAAVPELVAAIRQRRDEQLQALRAAPKWMSALVLLGRVGDPSAVPALVEVLEDKSAPLSGVIAAVRALGRIGDPSAAPAIRSLLERTDIDTQRFLQFSMGNAAKATEDARWQLDLAAAEALGRLGEPKRAVQSIARKYLDDDRSYVRRRARRVLDM